MRSKTLFTVVEGGERTYIHPFSYYDAGDRNGKNTLQFLGTPEFAPDQKETETDFLYQLQKGAYRNPITYRFRRFWDFTVRRFLHTFRRWSKYGNLRLLRNLSIYWDNMTPIYCASIYNGCITVPGTINVSYPGMKLTDSCYLIPSQGWLRAKLIKWIFEPRDPSEEAGFWMGPPDFKVEQRYYHDEVRNSYLTWANEQVESGRKIAFLSSLDTLD
jgi:hypothetical protein